MLYQLQFDVYDLKTNKVTIAKETDAQAVCHRASADHTQTPYWGQGRG